MKDLSKLSKTRRTITLWQLLLAIAVVGVVLGFLPSQLVAAMVLLFIEALLLLALLVLLVAGIAKRFRKQ